MPSPLSPQDYRDREARKEAWEPIVGERREHHDSSLEAVQACLEERKTMDYHSDTQSVSRSMLSVLKESPRLYYELYVAKSRQPSPPTEAMIRGTRFEPLLMEPRTYYAKYAVSPATAPDGRPWDRRTKEHRAAWQAWCAENVGKEPVDAEEHGQLIAMVTGALRHSEIERVVSADGHLQHRLDWHDPTFGVRCRLLADKTFVANDLIVDIKTAEDPSPEAFSRSVARHGYHRQQAWYSTGYRINFDETPRFLFCVIGSKPPYDAAVYELDQDAVDAGHSENEHLLRKLVGLQSSGQWYPSWGSGVVTLGLPKWHNFFSSEVYE